MIVGGRQRIAAHDPKKPCASNTVRRWWYRMVEQAGLVGHGVRTGLNMHRARHTFATELRRVAGVETASQALGHSDLSTTLGIYGHRITATSSAQWMRLPGHAMARRRR